MKRDLDLIRKILLTIEGAPKSKESNAVEELESEHDYDILQYHLSLLLEAGLINAIDMSSGNQPYGSYIVQKLTWSGHEFLDTARNDTRWEKAKEATKKIAGISFDVLKALLIAWMKEELGI
jgi:hypothetical protein